MYIQYIYIPIKNSLSFGDTSASGDIILINCNCSRKPSFCETIPINNSSTSCCLLVLNSLL